MFFTINFTPKTDIVSNSIIDILNLLELQFELPIDGMFIVKSNNYQKRLNVYESLVAFQKEDNGIVFEFLITPPINNGVFSGVLKSENTFSDIDDLVFS